MKTVLSILFLFILGFGYAQNLVTNPSFEEYYVCPTAPKNLEECKSVFNPMCANTSIFPCMFTPEYFNSCASYSSGVNVPYTFTNDPIIGYSYREAKEGEAFIGISTSLVYDPVTNAFTSSIREYAQIKLSAPLISGKQYDFSFYAGTPGNKKKYNIEINQLGIHFVNDSIIYPNAHIWNFMDADWVSNEYITDSIGWQKLSGSYIAHGGEKWLIIGVFSSQEEFPHKIIDNFYKVNKTAYTYLDYFSLEEKIIQPPTPTITTTPATCTSNGNAVITNYDTSYTYTFSPTGPTVDNNGVISGMVAGTSYTIVANNGTTNSVPSDTFSIDPQLPAPNAPTVTSPQAFCGSALVNDLTPSTAEYSWYTSASGGTSLNSNTALSSGTYYVSQIVDGCESERVEVVVQINPLPNVIVNPNQTICNGISILLTASGADSYTWSPTNENGSVISVSPNATTTYTVTGTSQNCSNTASVTITVVNNPVASFNTSVDTDNVPFSVTFTNTSTNATSYTWSIDSAYQNSSKNFAYSFENEGAYIVTLIASNGVCSNDTVSKMITALPSITVNIPNVFTPNNDGNNDIWLVTGNLKSIIILNRWGNVVFSDDQQFNGWNGKDKTGKPCVDGVYFYKIEDVKGEIYVGFLTLLR